MRAEAFVQMPISVWQRKARCPSVVLSSRSQSYSYSSKGEEA
jgi:hypothetical protein